MRATSKTKQATINTRATTSYHGVSRGGEAYAFDGFKKRQYFASDRAHDLNDDYTRQDGKPLRCYGLEIEMVAESIARKSIVSTILDNCVMQNFGTDNLFKYQEDGSLHARNGFGVGVECITQPMTKEYIRNNYAAFKCLFNDAKNIFDISPNSTCGMHCNISTGLFGNNAATQADAMHKMYYIINKHFALFKRLFLRGDNNCTYFAPDCNMTHKTPAAARAYLLNHPMTTGHYSAINAAHVNVGRFELRIVGGCTSYGAFRNTMELVFFLVDKVKNIGWDKLDDFVALFSGCNQYVFDRLLSYADACSDYILNTTGLDAMDFLRQVKATTIQDDLI